MKYLRLNLSDSWVFWVSGLGCIIVELAELL